jgi:hypothetical protein
MKVPSFLKNKYVLYILSFLGIMNVLGYVALEDYNSMALFVVMLFLSRYFSKNWSLNILISILVSSVVSMNNKVKEGFKEGNRLLRRRTKPTKSNTPSEPEIGGKGSSGKNSSGKNIVNGRRKRTTPAIKTTPSDGSAINDVKRTRAGVKDTPISEVKEQEKPKEEEKPKEQEKPVDEKEKEKEEEVKPKEDGEACKAPVECASGGCNDGICGPPKSKFTNNVPSSSPSKVNGEEEEDVNVAAKMEDAYNSMNKLLGDGAMKSMAKETKQLVNQQKELMSTLNSMTPALNSAKETLAGLNLPNLEQMTGILKRFNK